MAYTDEKGEMICDWIADGLSLRDIEKLNDGIPKRTILTWLKENETFSTKYARARQIQADTMDELILEVANASTNETAQADRVKIDAYKWRAMKLKPDVYGDKVNLELSGNINHTANPAEALTTGTLEAIERELAMRELPENTG